MDMNWIIKVRVYFKGQVVNFRKKDGSDSCLFTCNLVDKDASEISATFFGATVVAKYYSDIEVGKVYLMSGGVIRENNKKFGKSKNDFQIAYDYKSHIYIREEKNDPKIPKAAFEFTKIKDIEQLKPGTTVDLIAVVVQIGPIETLEMGDGRQVAVRKIELYDISEQGI